MDAGQTSREAAATARVAQRTYAKPAFDNGNSRILFPVAEKIALHKAGATAGNPGSPTPPGGASLATMCT